MSALEQIPAGVAVKLRAQAAARVAARPHDDWRIDPASGARMAYDPVGKVWVMESRMAENSACCKAAEWLAGLNTMELQP